MIFLRFIVEKAIDDVGGDCYIFVNEKYKIVEEVSVFLHYLDAKGMSLNTIENYIYKLKVFYEWLTKENLSFEQITSRSIVNFVSYLNKELNKEKSPSPHTINNYISAITSFYQYLSNTRDEITNPLSRKKENYHLQRSLNNYRNNFNSGNSLFRRKTKKNNETKRLFATDIEILQQEIAIFKSDKGLNLRNKLIFEVLYQTGMRIGECLGLRLDNFSVPDPSEEIGIIYVEEPDVIYHKDHNFKTLSRNVPVSMDLIFEIESYITFYRPNKNKINDTIFVNHFGSNKGNFMKRNTVNAMFYDLSKLTGIHCTPHKLRHTHGTELAEMGYRQEYIQNRLGHSSIDSTNQYLHISLKKQIEAYEAFINIRERK